MNAETDVTTPSVSIEIQVAADVEASPPAAVIESWIRDVLAELGVIEPLEVSLRIVAEAESRDLNRRYRGKDRPTNVLSFPAGNDELSWPPGIERPLGDIVICGPVVDREAREQGKERDAHWAHLLVHGTLHLLGYDHEEAAAAEEMEALETRILAAGDVGDPYAA
jgi:probable rRNA maturation factor